LAALGLAALGFIIFLIVRRLQSSPNRIMVQAAVSRSPGTVSRTQAVQAPVNPPPFKENHSRDLADYAARSRQRGSSSEPRLSLSKPVEISPTGPLLLNLFVEDQNTFIGKRNIHALKSGYGFSVGGGNSDFLIFLVPMPPAIGEVRRDGSRCTFIPRKPRYFPDLGSRELPDCIGKTIRAISDKNYEIRFRLEQYEDPLIALNRLLSSIKLPG
jgi:hypothetical protein